MIQAFRTLVFRIGLVALTCGLLPMLAIGAFKPPLARNAFLARWSTAVVRWLTWSCGVRYVVEGAENVPADNAIVLCKHQSSWETFGLQAIFPAQTWVLKRELLRIPIFGWALRAASAIAIDRGAGKKALMQLVEEGRDRLDRGFWVVVFPEGTRTGSGEKHKYNPGGAMLAARTGYPVVPVAHDAGRYWGRGFVIRPGTVRVVIGEPIATVDRKTSDINVETADWIEARMDELAS